MLERHIIELSGRDTLTPVLKKVGTEAENAGRKAEDASKRATRSMADWDRAGRALGAGMVTLGGLAIKLGNDSEVAQSSARAIDPNTGAAYEDTPTRSTRPRNPRSTWRSMMRMRSTPYRRSPMPPGRAKGDRRSGPCRGYRSRAGDRSGRGHQHRDCRGDGPDSIPQAHGHCP